VLVVSDVSFRYSRQNGYALERLSFRCDSAGITTIVGRSGVGKSTLIGLVAGAYYSSDSVVSKFVGDIQLDGKRPSQLRGPAIISWVPQEPTLLDHLTVIENILLPLTINADVAPDASKAESLLEMLGIGSYSRSRVHNLSGGMKTRVSLARSLVSEPRYLFLDEPFAALDLMNRWNIYGIITALRKKSTLTTIMTSHDIPEAAILSDRIITLKKGSKGTDVKIIENQAELPSLDNASECLRAAREIALPIEAELLSDPWLQVRNT